MGASELMSCSASDRVVAQNCGIGSTQQMRATPIFNASSAGYKVDDLTLTLSQPL